MERELALTLYVNVMCGFSPFMASCDLELMIIRIKASI